MDPIPIVLLKPLLENSKFKSGGPRPMRLADCATYGCWSSRHRYKIIFHL